MIHPTSIILLLSLLHHTTTAQQQQQCTSGKIWNECGSACEATCNSINPMCTMQCVAKCECPANIPIFHDNYCIKVRDCPNKRAQCIGGRIWNDCATMSRCVRTCDRPNGPPCPKMCAQRCACRTFLTHKC